jgi:hypothetical protein
MNVGEKADEDKRHKTYCENEQSCSWILNGNCITINIDEVIRGD